MRFFPMKLKGLAQRAAKYTVSNIRTKYKFVQKKNDKKNVAMPESCQQ